MRAKFIKKIIIRLEKRPSGIYRNIQLQILLWLTAKAFRLRPSCILFSKKSLEKYALFSKKAMNQEVDLGRVYDVSYSFGKKLVAFTGLFEAEDLAKLVYVLYQYIGIKMTNCLPEEFHIQCCYFSDIYEPEECHKMSAMDSGLIAGIYSELIPKSKLKFTERLTEGCSVCKARFQ